MSSVTSPKNLEYEREKDREYHRNNLPKVLAKNAKRRARELQATPSWLSKQHLGEIETIYEEAARLTRETGVLHHVDHIIPLKGKGVSGLHVPWNLRAIPAVENLKKNNKYSEGAV